MAGPVGSGKNALVDRFCRRLWENIDLAVVTNDFIRERRLSFCVDSGFFQWRE